MLYVMKKQAEETSCFLHISDVFLCRETIYLLKSLWDMNKNGFPPSFLFCLFCIIKMLKFTNGQLHHFEFVHSLQYLITNVKTRFDISTLTYSLQRTEYAIIAMLLPHLVFSNRMRQNTECVCSPRLTACNFLQQRAFNPTCLDIFGAEWYTS